jgi:hypothetical protein
MMPRSSFPYRYRLCRPKHCARDGPLCFTGDAAIADDLTVGMLCGEDEDGGGRRSGVPSSFEKGCAGEDPLREALQQRGRFTKLSWFQRLLGCLSEPFHSSSGDLRRTCDSFTWHCGCRI